MGSPSRAQKETSGCEVRGQVMHTCCLLHINVGDTLSCVSPSQPCGFNTNCDFNTNHNWPWNSAGSLRFQVWIPQIHFKNVSTVQGEIGRSCRVYSAFIYTSNFSEFMTFYVTGKSLLKSEFQAGKSEEPGQPIQYGFPLYQQSVVGVHRDVDQPLGLFSVSLQSCADNIVPRLPAHKLFLWCGVRASFFRICKWNFVHSYLTSFFSVNSDSRGKCNAPLVVTETGSCR